MTILKGLAAAVLLGLSVSAAMACDDYEEQMALSAAVDAAKQATAAAAQKADPGAQVAATTASPAEQASVAPAQPTPAPTQTTENSAGVRLR